MDKALIKVHELEQELEKIEDINLKNNEKIIALVEECCDVEYEIEDLEKHSVILECQKENIQEAPKKRKKSMKKLINLLILSYILIAIIGCTMGSILVGLGITTMIMAFASSIVIPIVSNIINEKYPIGNLDSIENIMLENDSKLNFLRSKKKEVERELEGLQNIRSNYENEIESMKKKISSIISLRTEVIEEFCNNNLELDKKIDKAYENRVIGKEKVKVVK